VIKSVSVALALASGLALSGCALLSTPDPVQMYRFGVQAGLAATSAAVAEPVQVSMRRIELPAAAEGDRILGVTGSEAAYIAGARWVSPAEDLFNDSLENSFGQSTLIRLIGRRGVAPSALALDVDVRTFEARYAAAGSTPSVEITARARLINQSSRALVAEQTFSVSQPASENRMSAIVQAFDIATRDINTQIVSWTEANAVVGRP
jgi:cholesterol transport system auxiliary component